MLLCTVLPVLVPALSFSPGRGLATAVLLCTAVLREMPSPVRENDGNVESILGDERVLRPNAKEERRWGQGMGSW